MKTAIVFLADGFEECEGLLVVDLLRRAEVNVTTASIMGRTEIKSSHGITLQADVIAEDVDFCSADMIILPGGLPGTTYLGESDIVKEQCLSFANDKYVSAFEGKMYGAIVTKEPVTVAGNIITGQGLGAGISFALKLVETLVDKETADKISASISFRRDGGLREPTN